MPEVSFQILRAHIPGLSPFQSTAKIYLKIIGFFVIIGGKDKLIRA